MKDIQLGTHLNIIDTLLEKRDKSYPWEFAYRRRINSRIYGIVGVLLRYVETPDETASLVKRVERI